MTDKPLKKGWRDATVKKELEEKDESFEIISVKEKYLRDQFAQADDALMKSEFGVLANKKVREVAEAELKKEQEKNAR